MQKPSRLSSTLTPCDGCLSLGTNEPMSDEQCTTALRTRCNRIAKWILYPSVHMLYLACTIRGCKVMS